MKDPSIPSPSYVRISNETENQKWGESFQSFILQFRANYLQFRTVYFQLPEEHPHHFHFQVEEIFSFRIVAGTLKQNKRFLEHWGDFTFKTENLWWTWSTGRHPVQAKWENFRVHSQQYREKMGNKHRVRVRNRASFGKNDSTHRRTKKFVATSRLFCSRRHLTKEEIGHVISQSQIGITYNSTAQDRYPAGVYTRCTAVGTPPSSSQLENATICWRMTATDRRLAELKKLRIDFPRSLARSDAGARYAAAAATARSPYLSIGGQ